MADNVKELIFDEEKLGMRSDEIDVRKENKLVKSIVLDLKFAIRKYGVLGMCANQIGTPVRIIVLNFNGDLRAFINPLITKAEGLSFNREVLPNLPGKNYLVPRYNNISVTFMTANGKIQDCNLLGVAAHIMQQQVDLLEGILISDVGFEIDEDFENASEEEKAKVMELFLESIDLKREELEKEINEDDDLRKMREGIDFIQSVQRGETKVEPQFAPIEEEKDDTAE